jgi:hypothetical protein
MDTHEQITVFGCVKKGTEAGCILLIGSDGTEYSLHGSSLPEIGKGLGVSVKGKKEGVTSCLQGTPLHVISWAWTREKCPK